jgi:hypothetical protein
MNGFVVLYLGWRRRILNCPPTCISSPNCTKR